MRGIQDGTEKRWEQRGREWIFMWSSCVHLLISGFQGSLSLLPEVWGFDKSIRCRWTSPNTSISMCPMDADCEASSVVHQTFASTAFHLETRQETWPPLVPDIYQRADAYVCICTNWCTSMREDLNWSHWIGEYVLIRNYSFFFFSSSLLFNPPDLVGILLSRCCCLSCKDAIFLPFLSCLTSTQTQDKLVFPFTTLLRTSASTQIQMK